MWVVVFFLIALFLVIWKVDQNVLNYKVQIYMTTTLAKVSSWWNTDLKESVPDLSKYTTSSIKTYSSRMCNIYSFMAES